MDRIHWLRGDDGNTLCADGHPIRIRRTMGDPPFRLEADGHITPRGYFTLEAAKLNAEICLSEMAEFAPFD